MNPLEFEAQYLSNFVYRLKNTRHNSQRLGLCEVCKEYVSEVHMQTEGRGADLRACRMPSGGQAMKDTLSPWAWSFFAVFVILVACIAGAMQR